MSTISITSCRLAAPALLLALAGCVDPTITQDTLPRKAISGSVTLDGQPLAEGKIQFDPVEAKPGESAIVVGDIKDGKYAIDRAAGPVPGNYKVSISSVPAIKIDPKEGPGARPKLPPEKVPAQYNTKSTLTKEIPADGSAPIDFPLTSK
jgi:hypothetical protein